MQKRSSSRTQTTSKTRNARPGDGGEGDEKVTISLSISRELLELLDKRWRNLPGLNRSTYFEILAQNDLKTGGSFTILEKDQPPEG